MIKFKNVNGFDELTKVIAAAMEEDKKQKQIAAELATASEIFVKSVIKTADKFGENRNGIMQTAAMGILQSVFDVDWDTFDPETGEYMEVKK